jgi:hypothetical protein
MPFTLDATARTGDEGYFGIESEGHKEL